MTRHGEPGESAERQDNGLQASAYVPLTDVDTEVGRHLLTALGRARIAAYLGPGAQTEQQRRLYVASEERTDARTIVAAARRALGGELTDAPAPTGPLDDPLTGLDTDAAFRALVADWHVDTVAAVRDAERDLTREDADWRARLGKAQETDEVWLDDDHYVPPPPPPLPRLAGPTIIALIVVVLSVAVLVLGGFVGLGGDVTIVLGICGLVVAAGILFSRLREHHRDEDDDGSAV